MPLGDPSVVGTAASGGNPAGAIAGQVVGNALSGLLGGSAAPTLSANSATINVAPVGVNLGEILKPYNQGSMTNGGFGLPIASRFVDGLNGAQTFEVQGGASTTISPMIIAAGLGAVFLVAVMVRKRG